MRDLGEERMCVPGIVRVVAAVRRMALMDFLQAWHSLEWLWYRRRRLAAEKFELTAVYAKNSFLRASFELVSGVATLVSCANTEGMRRTVGGY